MSFPQCRVCSCDRSKSTNFMLWPSQPGTCDICGALETKLRDDEQRLKTDAFLVQEKLLKDFLTDKAIKVIDFDSDDYYIWLKNKLFPNLPPSIPQELEYVFTLTTNLDTTTREDMLNAVSKLFRNGRTYKNEPIKRGAYCVEYTTAGRPHIHGIYTTGSERRITAKSFHRAWSLWNEKDQKDNKGGGGFHQLCKNPQKYNDYIAKGDGLGHDADLFIVPFNDIT